MPKNAPLAKKRETNTELVDRLMNESPTGALSQVMIIQAIGYYADKVIKAGPTCSGPMINGEAWVQTARYLRYEINTR